jgi:ABC-type amino acid transport substrate-binding protein
MKKLFALVIVSALAFSLAACGGNASSGDSDSRERTEEPTILTIGLANGIAKISWIDENGDWQGYCYEWLVKVDELLPQYVFKYEPITDFAAGFAGLDTKKYNLLAIQSKWTPEREEKYLLGNASTYENTGYTLKIKKGSNIAVTDEEDLGGLKIAISPGVSLASNAEQYNEEHPDNKIDIVWFTGTVEQLLADLQSGAFDGTFGEPLNDISLKEAYGDVFDVTGENLFYTPGERNGTYLLFNYGDEALRDEIDAAITELIDDGTLSALSEKLLGIDVTVAP